MCLAVAIMYIKCSQGIARNSVIIWETLFSSNFKKDKISFYKYICIFI